MRSMFLLILLIFLVGCTSGPQVQENSGKTQVIKGEVNKPVAEVDTESTSEPEQIPIDKEVILSCVAQKGDVCDVSEKCVGYWLEAADTFSCCSKPCTPYVDEVLEIEPYSEIPDDEELGDIV